MGPTGTRPGALGQDGDGLGINAYGTEWRRTSRCSNCRAAPRQRVREKHGIVSDIPLSRCAKQYVGGQCRLHRAGLLARSAVDAFDGVDIHLAAALVDTVRRAILEAGPVQYVHACFGDDIGHNGQLPKSESIGLAYPASAASHVGIHCQPAELAIARRRARQPRTVHIHRRRSRGRLIRIR